ncbi:sigma factor [Streptomyces sp. NPDC004291]
MAGREGGDRTVDAGVHGDAGVYGEVVYGDEELLARRFDADRGRLRAVAYRMLGSLSEAEDAVQETWLKLHRADAGAVENLSAWLTTVVGRVCLDMLRSRGSRRESPLEYYVPDPVVRVGDTAGTAAATGTSGGASAPDASPGPAPDPRRRREIADAFLTAANGGDFEGLLAVLDPDVVLRADGGRLMAATSRVVRGAGAVVSQALTYSRFRKAVLRVVANGEPAALSVVDGRPAALMVFTIAGDRIVELHVLADPERLATLGLTEEELSRAEP